MLKDQNTSFEPMDFLAGSGEMARRIREFDWGDHPFGPASEWPQSLRSALSICLNSAFPTAIYWGPDLRLLYNDAWAPIPGPRHPAALGKPGREVWSDIWHIIEPQFAEVVETGQGFFTQDQLLPMRRHGVEEETYWNYSFTPLRDEAGKIVGIFNSGSEVTENVVQRRNAEFLVALNKTFRTANSSEDALRSALAGLGELLGAFRVGIRERTLHKGEVAFALIDEWCDQNVERSEEIVVPTVVGERLRERFFGGRIANFGLRDEDLEPETRGYLEMEGAAQLLAVPWVVEGEVAAAIYLQWREERDISPLHTATIERVLETIMGWIERERNRERERAMASEIDHRARNLLAVVQSVTRMTVGKDAESFKHDLLERFAALSRVHGLLGQSRWTDVSFRDLVEDELTPYGEDVFERVEMSGPKVLLSASEAQLIAMLLHELTTNSAKHGFRGSPDGRLSLAWSLGGVGQLEIRWSETGTGSAVAPKPGGQTGGGYGSEMLAQVVQRQLGGELRRIAGADGLAYEVVIPRSGKGARNARNAHDDANGEGDAGAKSVLILEDDAIISMDLAMTLSEAGLRVFGEFATNDGALQALADARPDVAVIDANLSGSSSEPVASWLRDNGVPYVVVSGQQRSANAGEALADAPRFIKPIAHADLIEMIQGM